MDRWAADRLAEFDLDISPSAPTGTLSLAERQLLEVVKALLAQPKVLLLDEPTTALGPEDVDRLHALVHERSRAGVGIVYVSHRLPEVLGIADRISVLRDGVCQGTFEAASMSEESLVALMIGRPLQLAFPERHEREAGREVLLAVSGLRGDRFGPIDLEVASGEIVGIAGAEGNGQVQFLRALAGAERATGTATCDGKELDSSSPLGPLRAGVVLLSGDRASESLFPVLSVRANATIQVLRRLGRLGFLSRRRERRTVDDLVRRLEHSNGVDRAAGADALGRESAEGLADATVPARRRQGHPGRGADPGRRRRRAVRHLRRIAREGEGGRRHDRQVERPARARRPLRPGRRDVARADRRRDPRRRARGTSDRRSDRRLAGRVPESKRPRAPRSRREDRQVQRRVAARPDDAS